MRVSWSEVFENKNGMITPKVPVRIGGVQMTPGVSFGGGVAIAGVDLAKHAGKDLEVEQDKSTGLVTIHQIYG